MSIPAVVVEVDVPLDPTAAFRLFTEQVASWWPLASHSVFGTNAAELRFPAGAGCPIVEVSSTGEESTWGTVRECDPPDRILFSWHPGRTSNTAQNVEVTFTPAPGGTHVRLTHTGWESAGHRAPEVRANYATGWVMVLEGFTSAAPSVR
ncbi:MAG: SRPBCC domain-containing protein [Actinomycetota bacterium]|nr:SRPBCC domain-containing protein [Actinomycetota bacterium]